MCGRFVSTSGPTELAEFFSALPPVEELEPSYNVAPTSDVYALTSEVGHRRLVVLRWGLIPFWAKEKQIGARLINARSETASSKPAFRAAFRHRRCLIPVDGFFEWAKVDGIKRKQPYFIRTVDGNPLVVAGLWEHWSPPDGQGQDLRACTLLTSEPNREMSVIHHRMPALVPPASWDAWLDPAADRRQLEGLLGPAPDGLLSLTPVSDRVNNVRNQGTELIEPARPEDLIDRNATTIGPETSDG